MLWGIDRLAGSQLSATRRRLRNAVVAVLTHAAAVDRRGRHLMEVLEELGFSVRVLFTPEHGFDADAQAEEAVAPGSERWSTRVLRVSALKGEGLESFWRNVGDFRQLRQASGDYEARRRQQALRWMWDIVHARLLADFRSSPAVREALPAALAEVEGARLAPSVAARRLLDLFEHAAGGG